MGAPHSNGRRCARAELVPGSHKTFRTEREKEAMLHYNGLGEGKKFGLTKESPL